MVFGDLDSFLLSFCEERLHTSMCLSRKSVRLVKVEEIPAFGPREGLFNIKAEKVVRSFLLLK